MELSLRRTSRMMAFMGMFRAGDKVEILQANGVADVLVGKTATVTAVLADRVTVEIPGWFSANLRPEVLKKT